MVNETYTQMNCSHCTGVLVLTQDLPSVLNKLGSVFTNSFVPLNTRSFNISASPYVCVCMCVCVHACVCACVCYHMTTSWLQDLPLQIKWPNDIYYKDQVKLGGILVTSFAILHSPDHTAIVGETHKPFRII